MAFNAPEDIANRCLQHLGKPRFTSFTDQSEGAFETREAYDNLRIDELSNSLWRFAIKRTLLRPVSVDSLLYTPAVWSSATSYSQGAIVYYTPLDGVYTGVLTFYQASEAITATTTTPDADTRWEKFFGSRVVDLYTSETEYSVGEIVLVPSVWAIGTTYAANAVVRSGTTWYVSLQAANLGNVVTDTTYWAEWESNGRGDTWGETTGGVPVPLTYPSTPAFYLSLTDGNADNPLTTGGRWLSLAGTGAAINVLYPIGASNITNGTRTFRVPNGFLRTAPIDPKNSVFGVSFGPVPLDWVYEGTYFTSSSFGPLPIRFVADVTNVSAMDTLFCEALGARMAMDLAPALGADKQAPRAERAYARALSRARRVNALEINPTSSEQDTWILCRY